MSRSPERGFAGTALDPKRLEDERRRYAASAAASSSAAGKPAASPRSPEY